MFLSLRMFDFRHPRHRGRDRTRFAARLPLEENKKAAGESCLKAKNRAGSTSPFQCGRRGRFHRHPVGQAAMTWLLQAAGLEDA